METTTDKRFGIALRDLVLEMDEPGYLTPNGNVNWQAFVKDVMEPRGVRYETLRKALAGDRYPSAALIEKVAEALGVVPEFFAEYRLAQALSAFDVEAVGWEQAMANLHAWSNSHPPKKKRR